MFVYGNISQDQSQRQRALPAIVKHGEKSEYFVTAGWEEGPLRQGHDQDQGKVQYDVKDSVFVQLFH